MRHKIKITLASLMVATASVLPVMARNAIVQVDDVAEYVFPANGTKSPSSFTYMPDGLSYLMLTDNGKKVRSYDTASGKETGVVLDLADTRETKINSIEGFSLSPDGSMMLVWRESQSVYRRSFTASYYVFNIKRNILVPLSTDHPRQMARYSHPITEWLPLFQIIISISKNLITIAKLL